MGLSISSRTLFRLALLMLVLAWALSLAFPTGPTPVVTGNMARAAQVYSTMAPTAGALAPLSLQTAPAAPSNSDSPQWQVGFDKELAYPRPCPPPHPGDPCDLNADFHLGGFGIAPTRTSTGPAVNGAGEVEHLYARAMAVSNAAGDTVLFAGLENQGTFAAYKQGPYGLYDIRVKVSQDTGVPAGSIVINSDHSHAGPDLIGLWGGVPVSYLQLIHDQTVLALERAYQNRVPATLTVGSNNPVVPDPSVGHYLPGTASPGEYLDHSQFGVNTGPPSVLRNNGAPVPDPPTPLPNGASGYDNGRVDTQLRVLQAYGLDGKPLGTLINYAAHADVMDSSNLRYSADWPGRVATATEVALGEPVALTMVADVGRTQPPRPNSDAQCNQAGHPDCDTDKLDTYTRLMTPWVMDAVGHAEAVHGSAIASEEVFTRELATNPALLAVSYTGEAPVRGYGAYRATTKPWIAGDVLGTFASAHRIGDIILTANPGEAYPDIRFGLLKRVTGMQAAFTFGLANDQLGYLIAPASEYPWITYSNAGNDNALFNVSAQYGDHLFCSLTNSALRIGFSDTYDKAPYGPNAPRPRCDVLAASDAVAKGGIAPQQPWPFGDGYRLPAPFPQ